MIIIIIMMTTMMSPLPTALNDSNNDDKTYKTNKKDISGIDFTMISLPCYYLLIGYIFVGLTTASSDADATSSFHSSPSSISSPLNISTGLGPIDEELTDSYRAIKTLHSKLDVDADGEVDDSESKSFLESERSNHNNADKINYLHNDGKDRAITVDELWHSWITSEVYNWTTDETIYWLKNYVELPEYSDLFEKKSINGTLLPRLAADTSFIGKLGITDPSAKSRISIKAMDVVLFGPPKANRLRDIIVTVVVGFTVSLCVLFYTKSRASETKLEAMKNNLTTYQKSEEQLQELQKELSKALRAQEVAATEKKNLEHQLEVQWIRAPNQLKNLLQQTYDIESQYYNEKKLDLETKATEVKLRNQKLQKKKATFLGYYRMAQENCLEEDINTIAEVKEAIMRVTKQIKERADRWRNIEQICGCSLEHK